MLVTTTGMYGNDEDCTFAWNGEDGRSLNSLNGDPVGIGNPGDTLFVAGNEFMDGEVVAATINNMQTVQWDTDASVTSNGWIICAAAP